MKKILIAIVITAVLIIGTVQLFRKSEQLGNEIITMSQRRAVAAMSE